MAGAGTAALPSPLAKRIGGRLGPSRKPVGGFWRLLQRELGELFGGVGEAQAFAGSVVELVGDGVEVGFGYEAEVGALGEVLAQQAVGVLARPALPGGVRVAEVDLDAGVETDLFSVAHLGALV